MSEYFLFKNRMLNSHGRKPLYEAIRDAQAKSTADKSLQPLHPEPDPVQPETFSHAEPVPEVPKTVSSWPAKPRFVQFNGGRFEFSVPYQILIVSVLVLSRFCW